MNNVISFQAYVEAKQAKQAEQLAVIFEREAELARRIRLEQTLTDLLAELEAA